MAPGSHFLLSASSVLALLFVTYITFSFMQFV